jgi:predicted RNA-binding Zn-ribbon protein involved in translation (DUF1610 family)
MDLEEREGVESVKDHCQSCGAQLTPKEIEAALEGTTDSFLCTNCAAEELPPTEDPDQG